jgi:hypothetical protein
MNGLNGYVSDGKLIGGLYGRRVSGGHLRFDFSEKHATDLTDAPSILSIKHPPLRGSSHRLSCGRKHDTVSIEYTVDKATEWHI